MSGQTKAESQTFNFSDAGDFAAMGAAECFLAERGFSVGRNQRGEPRGILFGQWDIQKWRNLRAGERRTLHGYMEGDMRDGPVRIVIFGHAPDIARAALAKVESSK